MKHVDFDELAANIKTWAANAGFQEARITNVDLSPYEESFKTWIKNKDETNGYQRRIKQQFKNLNKKGFGSASWTVVEPFCHFTK